MILEPPSGGFFMSTQKISVIGCGWLGLPLAEELAKNYQVYGTTTTSTKLDRLRESGIRPVLLSIDGFSIECDDEEIWDADIIVIAIPPGVRKHGPDYHVEQMEALLPNIPDSKAIIYISSTSVYP